MSRTSRFPANVNDNSKNHSGSGVHHFFGSPMSWHANSTGTSSFQGSPMSWTDSLVVLPQGSPMSWQVSSSETPENFVSVRPSGSLGLQGSVSNVKHTLKAGDHKDEHSRTYGCCSIQFPDVLALIAHFEEEHLDPNNSSAILDEPLFTHSSRQQQTRQSPPKYDSAGIDLFFSLPQELLSLIPNLCDLLYHDDQRKVLMNCKGDEAQVLLDLFQALLDTSDLEMTFRSLLLLATRELSKRAGLLPGCYYLEGIDIDRDPVDGGGFSDIFKGSFKGHDVCLKAVRLYQTSDKEKFLKDISREGVLWAQLNHPNVVRMFGVYRYESRICFVSLWMKSGNIVEYLRCNPVAPCRHLAMDVAQGIEYLHLNGIVHGDLKGLNVLIDDTGVACLTDFGLSSLPSVIDSEAASTYAGIGTRPWTAPELLEIEEEDDLDGKHPKPTRASDMYSWACVCYEIFVGKRPFWHVPSAQMISVNIKNGKRPQYPSNLDAWTGERLAPEIWCIMEDCWKFLPSERPIIDLAIKRLKPMLGEDGRGHDTAQSHLSVKDFRTNTTIDARKVVSVLDNLRCKPPAHPSIANEEKPSAKYPSQKISSRLKLAKH